MAPWFNAIMFAFGLAALWFLWRRISPVRWVAAMGCVAAPAAILAVVLGGPPPGGDFAIAGLLAWGIFFHGAVLCLCSGALMWRSYRRTSLTGFFLGAALVAVACDAFLVEPNSLDVSRVRIESEKIEKPLKIVLLADLQADRFSDHQREALRRTMQEKPDLILLAGDYIQAPRDTADTPQAEMRDFLRAIGFSAPYGVFAVQGNVDAPQWARLFDGLKVTAVDATKTFDIGPLQLTCLALADSYKRNLVLDNDRPGRYHIVVGHCPNFALGRVQAELLLAGHTHGGQVRLALIGAVVTHSQIPKAWAAGQTTLPGGGTLLISRGIGVERNGAPRMRFLCRPELVVLELCPKH